LPKGKRNGSSGLEIATVCPDLGGDPSIAGGRGTLLLKKRAIGEVFPKQNQKKSFSQWEAGFFWIKKEEGIKKKAPTAREGRRTKRMPAETTA